MTVHSKLDYNALYFEFTTLDKITGKPDYPALARIFNQLKANASKVPSDLGGGTFGHLGLIMTFLAYQRVSVVPYVRPALPPPLVIPHGTT